MEGGSPANFTGGSLEAIIKTAIERKAYTPIERDKFDAARQLPQPVYAQQYPVGLSIYGTKQFCDFILHHPQKHANGLIIEAKWQQVGGTADQKLVYTATTIKQTYPSPTIIVLDGGGASKGADAWLRKRVDGKLLHVFNIMEFQRWANGDDL
jgi:hypothetical protein